MSSFCSVPSMGRANPLIIEKRYKNNVKVAARLSVLPTIACANHTEYEINTTPKLRSQHKGRRKLNSTKEFLSLGAFNYWKHVTANISFFCMKENPEGRLYFNIIGEIDTGPGSE